MVRETCSAKTCTGNLCKNDSRIGGYCIKHYYMIEKNKNKKKIKFKYLQ